MPSALWQECAQSAMRDNTPFVINLSCVWEATARKLGNVHPGSAFRDTTHLDFIVSGAATATVFDASITPQPGMLGRLILRAVSSTSFAVGRNTNLGIVLAIAPLALVPGGTPLLSPAASNWYELRTGVAGILNTTTVRDAECLYRAIREANPGGLGEVPEQDVKDEPTLSLCRAMTLAADRDLIARQYANGYADVFDLGVPTFVAAFEKFGRVEPAVIECQLQWMAAFPDSLIARKLGLPAAEEVQRRVQNVLELGGLDTVEGRAAGVELDRYLRSDGNKLNPGTTADLVTACLFVALREGTVPVNAPFHWDVPDWL